MKYRAEIDGLRAVAILPVVLFHAGFETFSGGFVGVDVFFVISGYLITSIILSEKAAGTFSLIDFYERRARRILPALLLVVAVCIPVAWLWLPAYDLARFSRSVVAVAFFASNVFFWLDGGYFAAANELKPLLHTWSLAVEEQFYLLFPLFIMLAWKWGRRRMVVLLAIAAFASFTAAQWGAHHGPVAAFFLLPTRGWELAIGAFLAFYSIGGQAALGSTTRQVASALGLLMIACAVFAYDKDTPFPGLSALVPTLGAALIILFATPSTLVGRLLVSKPIVGIGLISYSAYLWHQPVLAFARIRYGHLTELVTFVLIASVFILALVSRHLVEEPARDRERFPTRSLFRWSTVGTLVLLTFGSASALAFSSSRFGGEPQLAIALTRHPAVFVSNMDERRFIKHRLEVETLDPAVLVLGSSRIMQIGQTASRLSLLNLGVSGASIEDDIAIAGLALKKLKPKIILIGADPWLLNAHAGQARWRSISHEYFTARAALGAADASRPPTQPEHSDDAKPDLLSPLGVLYQRTNVAKVGADDDTPSILKAKIRRDGSRVPETASALTDEAMVRDFDALLDYSMHRYRFSPKLKHELEAFLDYVAAKHEVALVLSPYHPRLYDRMKAERPVFIAMERQFRALGASRQIKVLGSYDPTTVGCDDVDFYDGMHPNERCMKRVVRDYLATHARTDAQGEKL